MAKDSKEKLSLEDIGSFLSKLAENSDNVYWLSSPDFKKIQYISPAYEKIWGRPREDLYKNPEIWINFLHPDDAFKKHPIQEMAEKVAKEGDAARFSEQYRIIRPDGTTRWIMDKGFPVYDHKGKCCGVTGVAVDVTNEKEYESKLEQAKEKAEAANQAKTEFLENMRHDIRTPLTGIVGFSEILKSESNEENIKEYADNLVASSHALLDLLDEVLEAIRVSSGEIPKLKKKFNFKQSLENIIELNLAKAAEKKLSLTLDVDPDIPRNLIGDKVRIHRIVLELISNALNFTDSGFVKLMANLAKRNNRELVIKIVVEDSGIGIPKDKQQEIYVQFKRLTPSYQGIYKGAGLGLSVVKQFIDELGGEIYVESEPKKGSKFICIIPLQESLLDDELGVDEEIQTSIDNPYQKTFSQEIKPTGKAIKRTHKVLVVEDNVIAQNVAKSLLNTLGCDVDIADTGKKAVDLWKTENYDLIFMDIGLPDIDGYEVTHTIRVQEIAKKNHVPIIALTAHAGEENKKRCIEAGMHAVITKPLTIKSCTDIVEAFIPGLKKSEKTKVKKQSSSDLPEQETELFNLIGFPILDIEEGVKATGSEEMLAEMLKFMIDDSLPKDFELMKQAYNSRDWDKTQQIAHKIKGGAVYVGTVKIKMACQYLERYWKAGQRDLLEKLYQQTNTVIQDSIKEIKKWLEKH